MDKKNLMPQVAKPVNRSTTGLLPAEFAQQSEEALQLHFEADSAIIESASKWREQMQSQSITSGEYHTFYSYIPGHLFTR